MALATGHTPRLKKTDFFEKDDSNIFSKCAKQPSKRNGSKGGRRLILSLRRPKAVSGLDFADDSEKNCTGNITEESDEEISLNETDKTKNLFVDGPSKEEEKIIEQRVAQSQRRFSRHEKKEQERKITHLQEMAGPLTKEEALKALEKCSNSEEEAILRLTDDAGEFLSEIQRELSEEKDEDWKESRPASQTKVAKNKKKSKKPSGRSNRDSQERAHKYEYKRLRLNDALEGLNSGLSLDELMKDWSPARKKAFQLIETNPNAYYYRFNAPGEDQRNGEWDKEEKKLFMERLEECGADGQWGLFSMAIPGRVGYQCSNYYRSLILKGKLVNPNYFLDDKGKLRYKFKSKTGNEMRVRRFKRKGKDGDCGSGSDSGEGSRSGNRRSRRNGLQGHSDSEESDCSEAEDTELTKEKFEWKPKRSFYSTKRLRIMHGELNDKDLEEMPNPLPGVTDPITYSEIVMPAMSPMGHVMGLSSWEQCLDLNGRCPLTKMPLKKEQLIILTPENIERYRSKLLILK